uniref:Macroglobulin domain-containing protein n=1 Tax=Colobus angolensis palliatus TaxID=336983 RepID=A0A2K5JXR3_COLAP
MSCALLWPLLPFLLLLLSARDGVRAAQPQAPGYLIAAPSVFRVGVEEVISVTIFNSPWEVIVQAQLVAQGEPVVQSQGAILDKGTIKLKVPTGLRGQALLKVWGRGRQAEEGPLFHNQTSVTVDGRGASVFIQTDKPVYKPQHRVLISIFTVSPDLRPVNEKVRSASKTDPRGSRMIEWRHLKPLCCGITNLSFPLSDQPVLGEWFIFVEMQGHAYNKSFEVQKYGKLENLRHALSFCSRYTFGKPVAGVLTINMTVNGVGYYSHEVGRPVLRTTKVRNRDPFYPLTQPPGSPPQSRILFYFLLLLLFYLLPAEGVTVQIKAELTPKDNIYTSEAVSQGGLVGFEIPSIPTSAQHVWLEVFQELEDYDVSDSFGVSREDGPFWWAGLMAQRRRRSSIFPWPWGITKDSGFAFTVRRGNGTGGDDRPSEPEPPAGWWPLH